MVWPRIAGALFIATLGALNAGRSEAALIFSNPLDNALSGAFSNHDVGGAIPFQMTASSFVLDGRGVLTDVHWFGYFFGEPVLNPAFRVRLFDDDAGLPGTLRYEQFGSPNVIDTGLTTSHAGIDLPVFEFSLDPLPPVSLDAGVLYWISITHGISFDPEWLWSRHSEVVGDFAWGNSVTDTWNFRSTGSFAFSITGTSVPEPSGLVLLGAAALGFVRYTRRR